MMGGFPGKVGCVLAFVILFAMASGNTLLRGQQATGVDSPPALPMARLLDLPTPRVVPPGQWPAADSHHASWSAAPGSSLSEQASLLSGPVIQASWRTPPPIPIPSPQEDPFGEKQLSQLPGQTRLPRVAPGTGTHPSDAGKTRPVGLPPFAPLFPEDAPAPVNMPETPSQESNDFEVGLNPRRGKPMAILPSHSRPSADQDLPAQPSSVTKKIVGESESDWRTRFLNSPTAEFSNVPSGTQGQPADGISTEPVELEPSALLDSPALPTVVTDPPPTRIEATAAPSPPQRPQTIDYFGGKPKYGKIRPAETVKEDPAPETENRAPAAPYFVPAYVPIPGLPELNAPVEDSFSDGGVVATPPIYAAPAIREFQPPPRIQRRNVGAPPFASRSPDALSMIAEPQSVVDWPPPNGNLAGGPCGQSGCCNGASCGDGCCPGDGGMACLQQIGCPAFYFGFRGAVSELETLQSGDGIQLDTDDGSAFSFSVGRINGANLRSEVELAIRHNGLDGLLNDDRCTAATGRVNSFSGMANLYWEFAEMPFRRIRPYVGGGVGFASLDYSLTSSLGDSLLTSTGDHDSGFAYQWMAGVNCMASEQLDVFAEYRFFEADAFRMESTVSSLTGNYGYQSQGVGFGLRWKF